MKQLLDALKFYADESNYSDSRGQKRVSIHASPVDVDAGLRARRALRAAEGAQPQPKLKSL